MEGREELGRLFAYELHLVSENPNLPLEQLLGKPMSLSLELPGGSRRFHGIVARCSQVAGHGQFAGYQATLRPWPWLLTRTSDCRIFQNQSVPEIIKQVFRDLGFSDFEGCPHAPLPRVGILRAVPRDQLRLHQPADGTGGHLLLVPP